MEPIRDMMPPSRDHSSFVVIVKKVSIPVTHMEPIRVS